MIVTLDGEREHNNGLNINQRTALCHLPSPCLSISLLFIRDKVLVNPYIGHSLSPVKINMVWYIRSKEMQNT